jgi:glycosyltransferase involved in cell wall biosynthesis
MDGIFWSPVPQVLIMHDTIPLVYPEEAPRLAKYYRLALPGFLRHLEALVTVSQASKNDIVQYFGAAPDKVHIAYEGVNPAFANPALDSKPQALHCKAFFLFVGTFSPRKGVNTLIEALARLEVPECLVVVAYTDKWMQAVERRIAELGMSERVLFFKGLQTGELGYLYRHATALFLLSEYEGFGLPPLEAMLAGTPAVVSDSAALAEVVGDAAIKIKAHDVDATGEVMSRLSRDEHFREEWRQKGLERARSFTWDRTGEELRELLQQFA